MAGYGHRAARAFVIGVTPEKEAHEPVFVTEDCEDEKKSAGKKKVAKTPKEEPAEMKVKKTSAPEKKITGKSETKSRKGQSRGANRRARITGIIASLIFMPMIAALHLFVCKYIVLCAFVTNTIQAFIVMLGCGIYMYYRLSAGVRKLYFQHYRWKPWVYTVLYYLIFNLEYSASYVLFLHKVRTETGYMTNTVEGAFFTYVYRIFPLVIIAHYVLALLRWAICVLFKLLDKKAREHAATAVMVKEDQCA